MYEYIECHRCDSPNCFGCNTFALSEMLHARKLDCLLDEHHCINPCADVEVVKHGRWELVEYQSTPFDTDQSLVCTCCGFAHQHDAWFNRCPNCGAKMDLEVGDG